MSDGPDADGVDAIFQVIDAGTDLTWRYLLPKRRELSPSAVLVLNRLGREGPMRLTALATVEDTSQPAMTQLVQRMERQGLLDRTRDPEDGRAALVAISEAGRELWERRAAGRRERLADLVDRLPVHDKLALWLAARVALPILRQLAEIAASPER